MGNEAKQFLQSIQPYLRVKREQSKIAIEFQSHMAQYPLGSNKHAIEEYLALRERFRTSLRALTLGKHSLLIESQIDEDVV